MIHYPSQPCNLDGGSVGASLAIVKDSPINKLGGFRARLGNCDWEKFTAGALLSPLLNSKYLEGHFPDVILDKGMTRILQVNGCG